MKRKAITIGLLALAIAGGARANTLVYCSEGSPEGFNPQLFTSGTTVDASSAAIYNRLVDFKPGTVELQPSLAESWEVSEDGKRYTFHLRKGVAFQINKYFTPTRDFNADDVIFSFMRQKDANNPYHKVSNGAYTNFESMEFGTLIDRIVKVDDHTVRFELSAPRRRSSPIWACTSPLFFGGICRRDAEGRYAAAGGQRSDRHRAVPAGAVPEGRENPLQGVRPLLGRQTEDRPAGVFDHAGCDGALRQAAKERVPGDAVPQPGGSGAHAAGRQPSGDGKIRLEYRLPGVQYPEKPLDNVKVRQALALAVNKPAIIEAVFHGAGQPAKNLLPPTQWGSNAQLEDYPYSPERAKQLLQEAGLGQGFDIDLWAMPVQRPYNPNAKRMAEMIQADWAKIGVRAKIVTFEWGEYLQRIKTASTRRR